MVDASRLSWMSGSGLSDAFAAAREPDDFVARRIRAGVRAELLGRDALAVHIDRFVILERIGAGAMGVVYAAYDPRLDRRVALKVLWSADEISREWIVREARALARLTHPNVVTVHEIGEADGQPFVAMECVEGRSLREVIDADDPPPERIVELFVAAGRGLAAAHAAGILHRDFKPANVVVGDDGRVRVADFGLAVRLEGTGATAASRAGTPAYMAPEQVQGAELTAAADQYALCVALWEALAGAHPFAGSNLEGPRWPAQRRVAPSILAALERGLAPAAADRWPSVSALLDALVDDPQTPRRRRRRIAAAIAVLGLGGLAWGGWAQRPPAPCQSAEGDMQAVWNEPRRGEVEAAVTGTGAAFARATWERIEPRITDYADAWVAMRTETCEATSVRQEQSAKVMDLRMTCLSSALEELDSSVAILEQADVEVLRRAHNVIGGLPDLARCADVEALQADIPPPPPSQREAVQRARGALARIKALRRAGRYAAAWALIGEQQLPTPPYGPLMAEFALERGRLEGRVADGPGPPDALLEALSLGLKHRVDDVATEAAIALVYEVGVAQHRTEQAQAYANVADGLVERAGLPEAQTRLHNHLAMVYATAGDYDAAEAEARKALELGLMLPDPARERMEAGLRNTWGNVLDAQGRLDAAREQLAAALQHAERFLGPQHPGTAADRTGLAITLARMGELVEAEQLLRQALSDLESALGRDNVKLGPVLVNLSGVLIARSDPAAAVEVLERARDLFSAANPDHPQLGKTRADLANALSAQGKHEAAERELQAAVSAIERLQGADHPDLIDVHLSLGKVLRQLDRDAEATQAYRSAHRLLVSRDDSNPVRVGQRAKVEAWLEEHG